MHASNYLLIAELRIRCHVIEPLIWFCLYQLVDEAFECHLHRQRLLGHVELGPHVDDFLLEVLLGPLADLVCLLELRKHVIDSLVEFIGLPKEAAAFDSAVDVDDLVRAELQLRQEPYGQGGIQGQE